MSLSAARRDWARLLGLGCALGPLAALAKLLKLPPAPSRNIVHRLPDSHRYWPCSRLHRLGIRAQDHRSNTDIRRRGHPGLPTPLRLAKPVALLPPSRFRRDRRDDMRQDIDQRDDDGDSCAHGLVRFYPDRPPREPGAAGAGSAVRGMSLRMPPSLVTHSNFTPKSLSSR